MFDDRVLAAMADAVAAWEDDPLDDFAGRIVAALAAHERDRLATLMASSAECERRAAMIGTRPQGFHPDGTRVSDAEKRAVFGMYEQLREEHHRRAGNRWPVYAAASPDGPSIMIRHIFGLDG